MSARLLGVSLLWVLLLLFALSGGWAPAWLLVYALGFALAAGFVWSRLDLAGVRLRRSIPTRRLQVGDTLVEQVAVDVPSGLLSLWPRLWLEVRGTTDVPGHQVGRVLTLLPRRGVQWEVRTLARRRGLYTSGPIAVFGGDPLGLFRTVRVLAGEMTILVVPKPERVPRSFWAAGETLGRASRARTSPVGGDPSVMVRDYRPGDPAHRIHWRTSAHVGRLLVRETEQPEVEDVWVVLDLHAGVHHGVDAESTEECAVSVTASLASYFLEMGTSVGVISQSATLPTDRTAHHREWLAEMLAVAHARSSVPLAELLASESDRFQSGCTVVVVTPADPQTVAPSLVALAARGIRLSLVLVEPLRSAVESQDRAAGASALLHAPTYRVRAGASLTRALAAPMTASGAVAASRGLGEQ